ncbi:hypothetical protein WOLCODRAFT_151870 [Wolfiporia cocos MD-104 SS10]|uniref:Uncharacterized protein n=1 Tax=Wolfiporia cocos (strain MD-104) TaxID=742152 RepID=A0A2H3JYK4_WOLCO|nr:hypothetical protein WOLCODRAFT_151870 [Wolfiporia cocos MD-104 SS10]
MQARGVPAPPRAPSLQSTAHCGADRLNNRALGKDDPQLHPAPRAYPLYARARYQGNGASTWVASTTGSTVRLGTRRASRQAGYPPSAHGGTIRLNNWDLRRCSGLTTKHPRPPIDPRGNPARAPIERGAASATVKDAKAPEATGHPSPYAHPAGLLRQRQDHPVNGIAPAEGQYGKGNRPRLSDTAASHSHRPSSVLTQGRAKAHSRQGNPPHHRVEQRRRRFTKRATPSADRALTGRAAGTPQGSKAHRHTGRQDHVTERRPAAEKRGVPPPSAMPNPEHPAKVLTRGGGGIIKSPSINLSQRVRERRPTLKAKTHRQPLSTTLDSDAVTASQAKAAARETSQRRTQQEKSKKANLWELNAHVGLGQPRTRHHAQSGRSGRLSVTVPLA